MDKNLTVYPIPAGDELHIFSSEKILEIKISNMQGTVVYDRITTASRNVVDIKHLPADTYIVEAAYENNKKERSIFVKM